MHRRAVAHVLAPSLALASLLVATSVAAAPPPLPSPSGGGPTPAPSAAPAPAVDANVLRKGIVQVEQGGRPIAIGTVLSRDGRVLTSLSGLGNVTEPELRYADGSVVKAKVGHKDKGWDLALLVPQSGKWLDGLVPTDADPSNAELKAFLPKAGKLTAAGVGLKGRTDVTSKEGEPLKSVLDIDLKGSPSVLGAPVLDPSGKVVGVLVRACKDSSASEGAPKDGKTAAKDAPQCSPVTVAAPVYALRSFLVRTPATAAIPAPWLGLGGAPSAEGNVKGVKIMGIAPGSPAEKAGLKAGESADTIVAVDGAPVETPEQLAEAIAKHAIGQTVKLLVFSGGKFREAPVTLRPAP